MEEHGTRQNSPMKPLNHCTIFSSLNTQKNYPLIVDDNPNSPKGAAMEEIKIGESGC